MERILTTLDREPAPPWAPPWDAWELELRIRAALVEVGEGHGLELEEGPPTTFYGEELGELPQVLNRGRPVPAELWARACHLALFGRPDPPSR